MQGRDFFGAALRILGVWLLIQAATDVTVLLLRLNEALSNANGQVTQDKVFAGFNILVGFGLLIFADHIVKLVYGPPAK